MENIKAKLLTIDWQTVTEEMNEKGFAVVSNLLSNEQCNELIRNYDNTNAYRKKIDGTLSFWPGRI